MIPIVGYNSLSNFVKNNYKFIAIGLDNTPPSLGDTTLFNELERHEGDSSIIKTNIDNDTLFIKKIFAFSNSYNIREMGLFSIDTMLFRKTPGNIIVKNSDKMLVNMSVVFEESD